MAIQSNDEENWEPEYDEENWEPEYDEDEIKMQYDEEDTLITSPEVFDELATQIATVACRSLEYAAKKQGLNEKQIKSLLFAFQYGPIEEYLKVAAQEFLNREIKAGTIQVVKYVRK